MHSHSLRSPLPQGQLAGHSSADPTFHRSRQQTLRWRAGAAGLAMQLPSNIIIGRQQMLAQRLSITRGRQVQSASIEETLGLNKAGLRHEPQTTQTLPALTRAPLLSECRSRTTLRGTGAMEQAALHGRGQPRHLGRSDVCHAVHWPLSWRTRHAPVGILANLLYTAALCAGSSGSPGQGEGHHGGTGLRPTGAVEPQAAMHPVWRQPEPCALPCQAYTYPRAMNTHCLQPHTHVPAGQHHLFIIQR